MMNPISTPQPQTLFDRATQNLLERLDFFGITPTYILVIGENQGDLIDTLQNRYPKATLSVLELIDNTGQLRPVKLKFPCKAYDLVFWPLMPVDDKYLSDILTQCAKKVQKEGVFMSTSIASLTVADTFENAANSKQTASLHQLGDVLLKTGFIDPVVDVECEVHCFSATSPISVTYTKQLRRLPAGFRRDNINQNKEVAIISNVIYGVAKGSATDGSLMQKDAQGRRIIPIKST